MENNTLSPSAQQLLDKVRAEGVLVCALECIETVIPSEGNDNLGIALLAELNLVLANLPRAIYLNESTTFHSNPLESAMKSIEKGHLAQGIRIKLETPVNWQKYSSDSRSVRYKIQAWGGLDAILHYDSLEHDDKMFNKAFSHIMDWINFFIIDDNDDDFAWYDMAVGQRASKLAYAIRRAIEKNENIEDIAAMIVCAEIHLRELMEEEKIAEHSNHGLFQMAGLLAIGKSLPLLTNSVHASSFAMTKIKSMLKNHFTEDYLHKEHSPMYHIFMTNYVSILLNSGFMSGSHEFVKLAKGAIEAASWFAQPDGMILQFGDTPNIPIVERANFQLHKYRNRVTAPNGLKFFEEGGLVVHSHYSESNGPQGYLAFNGGFHSRQHKHADDFNIQLFNNGVDILVDPGTFTYQYDLPERMYVESTRAHNCLEIDGLNYSRYRADAFGNAIKSVLEVGDCIVIEAEVRRKRLVSPQIPNNKIKIEDAIDVNIFHRRKIIYHPDNYMLVIDLMSSEQAHSYRQWYKINPELKIEVDELEFFLRSKEGVPIAKIQNLYPLESVIDSVSGIVKPELQGWVSLDGHTLQKANSISIKSEGSDCIIATVFDLNPTDKATYFFNEGTGGKYLRFSLKRSATKFEFVSRTNNDGTEITYNENDVVNQSSY